MAVWLTILFDQLQNPVSRHGSESRHGFESATYFARLFRVRTAFLADSDFWAEVRSRAATRDCFERASFDAAGRPSRLSPTVNGHLQATGFDAKGRKQYLYHAHSRSQRDAAKFEHLLDFGPKLPRLRRLVHRNKRERSLRKTRVIATVI
jgi:DNA topoisomerase-1